MINKVILSLNLNNS